MSEELNDCQLTSMISTTQQCDVHMEIRIGKTPVNTDTLVCSFQNHDKNTDLAFSSGPVLLICNGMSDALDVKKRFHMDFNIKKVFFHTFTMSRHSEKSANTTDERSDAGQKKRDYLVVCGEHKLQFISLPDYHFYHYEIPFKLRNVFSCSTSLLVERFYDSSTEQNFHHHDTFHLYSLSGPFGELLPVIYKTNGYHGQWKFCWQSHRDEAGMVDADRNFVVVYDQKEMVHRVYMARETEEQEVHAAIRYVETLRKPHDSTMFASSLGANSIGRTTHFDPTLRSPAMAALSEVIDTDIDGRSPMTSHMRSGFGHSTPNNPNTGSFPGTLPTPIYEGNNDSNIWATTPNTPRINTKGGLERNIHTRTLARMVNDEAPGSSSSPTQSYCRLQTTASPFHVSHLTQIGRRGNSNADLLRDFTRMIRDTPVNFSKNVPAHDGVDFGDLERDPDVDLLLSKVCLECVYVESKKGAIPKANKIFVSKFLSDTYLNLVSASGTIMKIIPVWKNAETTKRNLLAAAEPVTVVCVDATFVHKSGITITLGPDFTTTMYGGNEKISPLFIEELSNTVEGMNFRLFSFCDHHIAAVNGFRCIVLKVPETVECKASNDFMKRCFMYLDKEQAKKVLREWRKIKREEMPEHVVQEKEELMSVVIFMLKCVGIVLTRTNEPPRPETPDEHGGKQKRPRMSDDEVLALMDGYYQETTTEKPDGLCTEGSIANKCQFNVNLDDQIGTDSLYAREIFNAFHCQCEEWGIDSLTQSLMLQLAPYTHLLTKILNLKEYEDYYNKMFRSYLAGFDFVIKFSNDQQEAYLAKVPEIPSLWSLKEILAHLINKKTTSESLQLIPKPLSKEIVRLLVVIATGRYLLGSEVDLECRLFIGADWKRRLGFTKETFKSFRHIMQNPRLKATGRANQLMNLFGIESQSLDYMETAIKILLMKYQADAFAGAQSIVPGKCVYVTPEESHSITQLRWKSDIRKSNIEMMLNSTRPILIATNILRKSEEDNMKELQDRYLTQTSFRTFAQPFGRAYLDFRTSVPSLLTSLYIPRLCVGGMVYPARVTCDPPTSDIFKLCTEWGNFYNSLAAALRLGASDVVKIDNEWIVMVSKNIKSTAVIGGLTLGFGLNGHLAPFNMYHAHQMLSTFDKFHSIALLIGLSASNFTTCDIQIHKILATYLAFLMGPTPLEIKIDYAIQTAAISGLGLLFADSGNMNIAKKLINEIGKAPNKDEEPITDRPAYKLAAGFALGLIMLGKGNGAASSVVPFKQNVPPMSQRLVYMMNGMRRDKCVFLPQSATPVASEPSNLPFSNVGLMTSSQNANHVKEGDNINIHHCSEPAAIALGMMFMKTHNEFIAGSLALPDTITDIERIKPDAIYSRVLGYCLVMWDKIEPSHDFVKSLIPDVIQQYATSALHFGIPIPKDDDGEDVHETLNDDEERYWAQIIDTSTISQTFLYTVSAACMAIALKYSSCGGPEGYSITENAFKLIEFYTKMVLPEGKSTKDMGSIRMCRYAGSFTCSSCFSMLVTSMSILRVGTGDLTVLRYARLLRMCDKPDGDWIAMGKKHFEQTVAHQALGILMMGEGRYAFKKDNLSIALTIISTFPSMPTSVSDNSHYHQPLRFLWSMAVEPRLLVPFDISENCVVEVDITITTKFKGATRLSDLSMVYKQKAPSLLPPLEDIESISVGGGKYEVVHINLQTPDELKVMKDIMSIGQGRIMLKRFSVEPTNMKVNEAEALYNEPLDVVSLLDREGSALELDDEEILSIMKSMEEDLNLNSSNDYPNVQVQLNTIRDIASRTPTALLEMQMNSLNLLGGCLDLWPDEVNVANTVYGLSEKIQAMKI